MASNKDLTSLPVRAEALKPRVLVAAIDFGTTYSGYAFQTHIDFQKDPTAVKANNWLTKTGLSHKTPSCILFDKHKQFHSFGLDAESKYCEAAAAGETWNWYYFKRFKMLLYKEKELSEMTTLKDDKGLEMPALEVFSASIKYLKDHLLQSFKDKKIDIRKEDIHYVITVPAIWSDTAKRFMREAGINAGIHTDKLSLSLEPEAASLFCQYLPVQRVVGSDGTAVISFQKGDRYMILDAGGGTVDITVHEILQDRTLKEFAKANGGEWGGTKVDDKFEQLLDEVFGPDVMEVIRNRFREDYLDIMQNFEVKKRIIDPKLSGREAFKIPASILTTYKDLNNVDLKSSTLIPAHLQGKIEFTNDKMKVDADLVKGFFTEVCDKICAIADEFFQSIKQYNVDKILMVGGFSESAMLQDKVRKTFRKCQMIIPEDAGLAVLKGAVLFGHNPSMIVARVCRCSYGIRALKHYEPGIDPIAKRVVKNFKPGPEDKNTMEGDVVLCKDYFSKHATVGEEISTDEKRYSEVYRSSDVSGLGMEISVYTSPRRYPLYIDEKDCQKLGHLDVSNIKGKFRIAFEFGQTETGVKVFEIFDETTEREVKSAKFVVL